MRSRSIDLSTADLWWDRFMMTVFVWPILTILFVWAWFMTLLLTPVIFVTFMFVPIIEALANRLGVDMADLSSMMVVGLGALSALIACFWCWPRRVQICDRHAAGRAQSTL